MFKKININKPLIKLLDININEHMVSLMKSVFYMKNIRGQWSNLGQLKKN